MRKDGTWMNENEMNEWMNEMENKGRVTCIHADWKDHSRWRILNYDLVRRNFVLWIQVSSTAAKLSAAGTAAFGHYRYIKKSWLTKNRVSIEIFPHLLFQDAEKNNNSLTTQRGNRPLPWNTSTHNHTTRCILVFWSLSVASLTDRTHRRGPAGCSCQSHQRFTRLPSSDQRRALVSRTRVSVWDKTRRSVTKQQIITSGATVCVGLWFI